MRRPLLLSCLLALGGCAWEPGQGFARVEPTVSAAYEALPNRSVGDGYERLASDYQVKVDQGSIRLSNIALLASAASGGSFDPTRPPAGYSLCHNGHCHSDSGALVPYEQIAAELGGGGGASTVVTLSTENTLRLLPSETSPLSCSPRCDLPQTQVTQGRWGVVSLQLTGKVRDSRPTPRFTGERAFELTLMPTDIKDTAPIAVLGGAVDLLSDRTTPPETRLDLRLVLTAAFLDAVDWGALNPDASDGVVRFSPTTPSSPNALARLALIERLTTLSPTAEVTHGP